MNRSVYVPPVVEPLTSFVEAGVLGPTEVHTVASFVSALGTPPPADVLLAVALAVRAPLHGHVCVDLRSIASTVVGDRVAAPELPDGDLIDGQDSDVPLDEEQRRLEALEWPEPTTWMEAVGASPLVHVVETGGSTSELVPFVMERDLLYLSRFWVLECYAAADLGRRSAQAGLLVPGDGADPAVAAAMEVARQKVDELFPPAPGEDSSQRQAVLAALDRDFVVVAGGPGTGKTHTVARMLAALFSGLQSVGVDLEVALVAPTGKASARMAEAIRQAVDPPGGGSSLPVDDTVKEQLAALEATTIHRLLGRSSEGGFRHGPDNPLPHQIVVVDEVSMVSLSLVAHLLAAVRPSAKVVLVGDPFQLASVEAGTVLGDIVGLAAPGATDSTSGIQSSIRRLSTVHRQAADSGVLSLAEAIRDDRPDTVIDVLRSGRQDVAWVDPSDPAGLRQVERMVEDHATAVVTMAVAAGEADDLVQRSALVSAALASLTGVQVLSALRRGSDGVDGWNRRAEDRLRAAGLATWDDWYTGRPVMVLKNDYVNHVFNGDVGLAVPYGDRFQVWFPRSPEPLVVEASRVDEIATQWAMTIHKSQGSEFGHVVVTLPEPPSRILTRELLYTAV
ncbi:MAG: exodeoxyribonuclease V subunit alpha, partial [Actinomycetes bacterium]